MKNILKFGIISFAFGLVFFSGETANAQNRRAVREYRQDVREARRDYRRDVRRGENRREARREFRGEVRDARREYVRNVRRSGNTWYYYQNGRRYTRPSSIWSYSNGYFYRRY